MPCLRFFIKRFCVFSLLAFSFAAQAQSEGEDQADLDTIEAELSKSKVVEKPGAATPAQGGGIQNPEKISDLGKLSPFSEISVIQKRFLPKTERFQLFLGIATITNDPWFYGIGLGGRFGYSFKENLAAELNFTFVNTSEKDAVKDLKSQSSVATQSLVTAKNNLGVDLVWTPIYGKLSLFNKRIVPFDMYFAGGLGQTSLTNATSGSATAFHFGGGQIFAMSKGVAFRWDLSYYGYQATPATTAGVDNASVSQFNNLLLTIGASFFFPEAKYR